MGMKAAILGIVLAVICLTGCSGSGGINPVEPGSSETPGSLLSTRNGTVQGDGEILEVPYYSQASTQWCSFASAAMLVQYKGVTTKPRQIAGYFMAGPEDTGVNNFNYKDLEQYAALHGLSSEAKLWSPKDKGHNNVKLRNYIRGQLRIGNPVMVGLQNMDSIFTGHAVVVVGYTPKFITVHDPSGYLFTYLSDHHWMDKPASNLYQPITWEIFSKAIDGVSPIYPDITFTVTAPTPAYKAPVTIDLKEADIVWEGGTPTEWLTFGWDGKINPKQGFKHILSGGSSYHEECSGDYGGFKVHGGDRLSEHLIFSVANCYRDSNPAREFTLTFHLENTTTGEWFPLKQGGIDLADGSYDDGHFVFDPRLKVWSEGVYLMEIQIYEGMNIVDSWQIEFLVGPGAEPPPEGWTEMASMDQPRAFFTENVVDGNLYVIGGLNSSFATVGTVECYDPDLDEWRNRTSMPTARYACSSAVIGGLIYVFGGSINWGTNLPITDIIEIYDPAADSWTPGGTMPAPRTWPVAESIGEDVFITGGFNGYSMLKTGWKFDPDNPVQKWSDISSMPIIRSGHDVVTYGGQLYSLGGYIGSPLLRYTPTSNSWTSTYELAQMPTDRLHLRLAIVGDSIYATGGTPVPGPVLKTVEVYDISEDSWYWDTDLDLPIELSVHGAIGIDQTIYVFGGRTIDGQVSGLGFKRTF